MLNEPISQSEVCGAVGCGPHELVSFVGGGGKTALMHAFANQLSGTRLATTTTKMSRGQHGGLLTLVGESDKSIVAAAAHGPIMVWDSVTAEKAHGIEPSRCDRIFQLLDHVLVEADGARSLPFKAPGAFEPVVPLSTTLMVSVIGADALGRSIAAQCHRPMRVAALAACNPYQSLTPARAAAVLLHPRGNRSALGPAGRLVVAITKVEKSNADLVGGLVDELRRAAPDLDVVVVRSFHSEP